ncbi:Serine Hydroxymethyltransferase, Cytosolic [Manis pentadactyla]|nr:Serine Hydroxymethyltransferase, Cytosolic [Manis pentadactyla]
MARLSFRFMRCGMTDVEVDYVSSGYSYHSVPGLLRAKVDIQGKIHRNIEQHLEFESDTDVRAMANELVYTFLGMTDVEADGAIFRRMCDSVPGLQELDFRSISDVSGECMIEFEDKAEYG